MTTATTVSCACASCTCTVDPATAVTKGGNYYCCEACANGHSDGSGCAQSSCGCASN